MKNLQENNFQALLDWINQHLSNPTQLGVLLLAFSYVGLVIGVRWQMIARPIRNGIRARLKLLMQEAQKVADKAPYGPTAAGIAKDALNECERSGLFEVLFWSRGKETSLWQMIDKAESYLVYTWSVEKLLVRSIAVSARLENLRTAPEARQIRNRLEDRITHLKARLAAPAPSSGVQNPGSSESPDKDASNTTSATAIESDQVLRELAELYREAVRVERTALVSDDVELDHFNNKILWHIMISLAAIVFIANIAPGIASSMLPLPATQAKTNPGESSFRDAFILMLLTGAVGGILSRLTSALQSVRSPTERGTSWMAMFMSPLAGALAGWAGCLLLSAARQLELILPSMEGPKFGMLLAGASVLFGFSERLFIGIATKIEEKALREPAEKHPEPGTNTP